MNGEDIFFTKEEVLLLSREITSDVVRTGSKDLWKKAFDYYNSKHPSAKPFSIRCKSCYSKVLLYIAANFKEARGT